MNKLKLLIHSILSITIACICILFFIQNSNSEFNLLAIMSAMLDGWFYLMLACTLLIISVYCRVYRWEYLFDSSQVNSSNILLRSVFIGYFTNNIFPIRIGDLIRSYVVSKNSNHKTSYIIGSIAMERFLDILMICCFALIVVWHYGIDYLEINYYSLPNSFYILCGGIIILIYLIYKYNFFIPDKIAKIFNELWKGFSDIRFTYKKYIIFYSIIIWVIYAINVFLIQSIFNHFELSIFDCLLILVASSFLQMIPLGFGSIGIFHLGIQGALNKLGIQDHNIFIIMLHLYSIMIYTLIGGYYFLISKELRIKQIYNNMYKN
tara:strand:+ start:274 stop:1236 length:963 start_codon:yes stop_codon:yes gene_type:complete